MSINPIKGQTYRSIPYDSIVFPPDIKNKKQPAEMCFSRYSEQIFHIYRLPAGSWTDVYILPSVQNELSENW